MSLLCALGWHQPDGLPRWNDGFYFARCARCGCDLVRTAYQRWHVPEGYRVVWSAQPPQDLAPVAIQPHASAAFTELPADPLPSPATAVAEGRPAQAEPPAERAHRVETPEPEPPSEAASPAPAGAAAEAAGALAAMDAAAPAEAAASSPGVEGAGGAEPATAPRRRLPVDELFGRLRRDRGTEPPPRPESTQSAPTPRESRDFMADDPSDEIVIVPAGTRPAGQAESMAPTGMKPPLQDADVSRTRWTLAPVLTSLRARLGTPATWEEPSPAKVVFAALAISAAIAALVLALLPSPTSDETAAVGDQPQLAAPAPLAHAPPFSPLPQTDVAQAAAPSSFYVAARSLACRDAASLQGRRVRDLVRGTSVTVLALAGEWDSISYLGRQCWVLARYLSPVPPAEARAMPRRELRHACPARRARHPCPNL